MTPPSSKGSSVVRVEKAWYIALLRFPAAVQLALEAFRAGNLARSRELLERALDVVPDHPEARFNLGILELEEGRASEAIAAFEKVLTIAPGQGAIHQALVPLYQRAGDDPLARKHRSEARRLPPGGFRPR